MKLLAETDLLENNRCSFKENLATEVWIGEMPASRIWDYYKQMNCIAPNTWQVLEKARAADTIYEKRFPVIVLKDKLDDNESLLENNEMITSKKSILID